MNNNDVLRRIRYVFDFNDDAMIAIFGLADHRVTRAQISNWLKKDDDPSYREVTGPLLATFLNGLIVHKRGKKDGPSPAPEKVLTNNIIFKKLRIALNYKSEDILAVLDLAEHSISPHELSAFFRTPGNRHYRECQNQILRNFLNGLQLKLRPGSSPP